MPLSYQRALCKLSGEAFSNNTSSPYDEQTIDLFASTFLSIQKRRIDLAFVVGAGNLFRAKTASLSYPRSTLDEIGMLATIMNGKLLSAAIEKKGGKVALFNAFPCGNLTEDFSEKKAEALFKEGYILIFTGGTGYPFFTTDTAAALRALQIKADVLIKLSTVDGIYTEDPKISTKAEKQTKLSYDKFINDRLDVMDLEAVLLCQKENVPIIVGGFSDPTHLEEALFFGKIGTLVTNE